MNIYFACSITGGRQDEAVYKQIVAALEADGHTVPTAILASSEVVALEAVAEAGEIYARDTAWIRGCDLLVAEISTPSHGVGYEIGYALALGKPVLCLHQADRKVSKMISGNPDGRLTVHAYREPLKALQYLRTYINGQPDIERGA
jgi:nucleoside 2-deoxyribosyltransferase